MVDYYTDLTKERFDEILGDYAEFLTRLDKVDTPPHIVYKPLGKKNLEDIMMIREMSSDLQQKKDDDIKKAAQAASEAAEAAEKAQKEKAEKNAEEKTEEKPAAEKEN